MQTIKDALRAIVSSPLVWGAFLAALDTILPLVFPNLNQQIWVACRAIITAILGALGVGNITLKVYEKREARRMSELSHAGKLTEQSLKLMSERERALRRLFLVDRGL